MNNNRPISPHLSIYKFQITSMLSSFHRITGAFLAVSLGLFVFLINLVKFNTAIYSVYSLND